MKYNHLVRNTANAFFLHKLRLNFWNTFHCQMYSQSQVKKCPTCLKHVIPCNTELQSGLCSWRKRQENANPKCNGYHFIPMGIERSKSTVSREHMVMRQGSCPGACPHLTSRWLVQVLLNSHFKSASDQHNCNQWTRPRPPTWKTPWPNLAIMGI